MWIAILFFIIMFALGAYFIVSAINNAREEQEREDDLSVYFKKFH
mgnify:CR=1 FL=1